MWPHAEPFRGAQPLLHSDVTCACDIITDSMCAGTLTSPERRWRRSCGSVSGGRAPQRHGLWSLPGRARFLCCFNLSSPPASPGGTCACPLAHCSVLHGADASLAWSPRPVSAVLVSDHRRKVSSVTWLYDALTSLCLSICKLPLSLSGLWLLFQPGKTWYAIIFIFQELKKAHRVCVCVCAHTHMCVVNFPTVPVVEESPSFVMYK